MISATLPQEKQRQPPLHERLHTVRLNFHSPFLDPSQDALRLLDHASNERRRHGTYVDRVEKQHSGVTEKIGEKRCEAAREIAAAVKLEQGPNLLAMPSRCEVTRRGLEDFGRVGIDFVL